MDVKFMMRVDRAARHMRRVAAEVAGDRAHDVLARVTVDEMHNAASLEKVPREVALRKLAREILDELDGGAHE